MFPHRDIAAREKQWEKDKVLIEREIKLRNEQKELYQNLRPKKKTTTTKLLIFFLFLNCTLIEIFTAWATIKSIEMSAYTGYSADFTPLTTLIGTVVGEVIGFGVYAVKSIKENTAGGIVYDSAFKGNKGPDDEVVG